MTTQVMTHDCPAKMLNKAPRGLDDVVRFGHYSGKWIIDLLGEAEIPIVYCPFCGHQLEQSPSKVQG